jgi:MFS family permease
MRWAMPIALVGPALTFVTLPPALPQIAAFFEGAERGKDIAQQLQTLPFLGLAIGGLIAGWVIRYLGHRRLLRLAAALYLAAGLVGLMATQAYVLMLGSFLLGITGSLMTSDLVTFADEVLSPDGRSRMLGWQTAIADFSTVAGAIAGAALAQFFGWHAAFSLYVGYGALMLSLALTASVSPSSQHPATKGGMGGLLGSAWPTYLAAIGVFMLVGTQTTQVPFFLAAHGFDTPAIRAVVLTCSTLAAMCGAILYALGRTRLGDATLRIGAICLTCAGFIGLAFWSGTLPWACLAAFSIGLGIGVTVPALFASALRRSKPAMRGHSVGMLNTAIFLGGFVSPIVFTPVTTRLGYPALFLLACLAALLLGVTSLLWTRSSLAGPPRS